MRKKKNQVHTELIFFSRRNTCGLSLFVLLFIFLIPFSAFSQAAKKTKPVPPVALGSDGRLVYGPDALGNRIPDFSYAGYKAGTEPIPDLPVRVVVPLIKGDATHRIQFAIDYVSALPADANGLRGAVLLEKGRYELSGRLHINASGVVLRGSGAGPGGTVLFAKGTDRETLIRLVGKNDRKETEAVPITDGYVPVNAMKITLTQHNFHAGDRVVVHRPSTKNWIDLLGTDHFGGGITALGWKPGQRDIAWERKILTVNGQTITLDAPLTTALDTTYGISSVTKLNWPGRIAQSGVENLRLVSDYAVENSKDEDHAWMAITMENISDGWVRQVSFEHFAGSAVALLETAKCITVEDCQSLAPISEVGGQRRYSFFTAGQQTLFQRCYAEFGFHDFAVGFCAPGPNAFVQCESHLPHSFSGTIDSWASGVLFDIVNVDGQALSFMNRGQDGQGAGWSAANSMFWQCSAARIDCYAPPGAMNWAYGSWAQFAGDGYWESSNEQIKPRSFYYAQLSDRLGQQVMQRANLLKVETEASSSPPVEVAMALTKQAYQPAARLTDWIDAAPLRQKIPVSSTGIKTIEQLGFAENAVIKKNSAPLQIKNGWLTRGNAIVTGWRQEVPWWSGSARTYGLREAKPAITRYVPGKTGKGLTDDLDALTDSMADKHQLAMEQNYALWYDRRRDDHERIRRMDGDVWPPFYEVPFARSGKDTAWDGLSKYDLTKYNKWYWGRLKKFADLADQKGLVLVHQNYFQHNIIEAGAHYADFTWRPVNNINNTGFPEPAPYAGDKRIFMAEQFYDITQPVRRKLHRAYIRQCLDNFKDNNGVIQLTGAEFTGPLHFVQFWLDTIKEWEKETGKKVIVGLSTTKDVQDSILADKSRSSVVDLIDIRYWHYRDDGTAYAPLGGQNLAPRQHARLVKPGRTSFDQVYRAVREYRTANPGKAVVYSGDSYDDMGWAAFMAGGSMPNLPGQLPQAFLEVAATMEPLGKPEEGRYMLGREGAGYIIYLGRGNELKIDRALKGKIQLNEISTSNGNVLHSSVMDGNKINEYKILSTAPLVLWIAEQ